MLARCYDIRLDAEELPEGSAELGHTKGINEGIDGAVHVQHDQAHIAQVQHDD